MNMIRKTFLAVTAFVTVTLLSLSCSKEVSRTTGWEYSNPDNGGFELVDFEEQETGPGLVFVEGGTFTMGANYDDPIFERNNPARRITVRSFYMDETEVRNLDYVEYLYWLSRVFGTDHPEVYQKALPDTLVWRERLAYNEPLVELYLRHPAYRDYPVVGVNWLQANDYCAWRTDRVNEQRLISRGILEPDPDQMNEYNFNTEAYLAGEYEGIVRKNLKDLNPNGAGERRVKMEDGILLPRYRLPTEAEWEYAAMALVGNTEYERITDRRMYPWNGQPLRANDKEYFGIFLANYKRGRGDYAGVAGDLNDAAIGPAPVATHWANDFGLFNMGGNVSEWVADVYRPMSHYDVDDLASYRGNVFLKRKTDEEGNYVFNDTTGRIEYEPQPIEEIGNRQNYRKSDNINYRDGDYQSSIGKQEWTKDTEDSHSSTMYDYSKTSMINDKVRVYKGGSWKDGPYYLMPATRRYLDESLAANYIGFRCAMDRTGDMMGSRD